MSDDGFKADGLNLYRDRELGEPPPLRIIRGPLGLMADDDKGIRPCDHPSFVLDEKWRTVTCTVCKEKVDAYAALSKYARWYERVRREHENMEHSEWRMLGVAIRNMLKRRQFTDEERERIGRETHMFGKGSLETIRKVHAEISKRVSEAKSEGRRRRRQTVPT